MTVRQADKSDLEILARLFNGYRMFYRQTSDIESCKTYLDKRISANEAIIFIAFSKDNTPAGFTLLYPSFSSVSMAHTFILNDLFVLHDFRRLGIAHLLLQRAIKYGRDKGAIRLHLETEITNTKAQALYEKGGWKKDLDEYHYYYTL